MPFIRNPFLSLRLCIFQEGEVVERGTHDELLAVGGEYAAMWHQQSTAGNDDRTNGLHCTEQKPEYTNP